MKVEIWSDIVCPWCYIGKRRFETALTRFAHSDQVEVVWRSFELDPNAPQQVTGTLSEMLSQKYGVSPERAAAMNAQVTTLAAREGLDYQLDHARPGNTFDAHRLIHLAADHNQQAAAKERLMHAYFTEGAPISDPETLVSLGAELGIPTEATRSMLASDTYARDVQADERRATQLGIRGVPFFVIDEQFGVSGAQEADVLLGALEQAWAATHPLTLVGNAAAAEDTTCVDGSCAIA